MTPYFQRDGVTLYHGDCREVLPAVDLQSPVFVTDPPFGVRDEGWDNMDAQEFALFSMEWLTLCRRRSEELIAFCSCYGPFRGICELLYPRVRVMVWDKPIGSQYAGSSERGLWFAHETILHCYRKVSRQYVEPKSLAVGQMIKAARERSGLSRGAVDTAIRGKKTGLCFRWEEGACLPTTEQVAALAPLINLNGEFEAALAVACVERNKTLERARAGASENAADGRDVFSYRTETDVDHPCQKPVGMMAELLERLTEPDALIVDPFCGSGSTLRAALDTGRQSVGVESDERHCETAARRLEQGVLNF